MHSVTIITKDCLLSLNGLQTYLYGLGQVRKCRSRLNFHGQHQLGKMSLKTRPNKLFCSKNQIKHKITLLPKDTNTN